MIHHSQTRYKLYMAGKTNAVLLPTKQPNIAIPFTRWDYCQHLLVWPSSPSSSRSSLTGWRRAMLLLDEGPPKVMSLYQPPRNHHLPTHQNKVTRLGGSAVPSTFRDLPHYPALVCCSKGRPPCPLACWTRSSLKLPLKAMTWPHWAFFSLRYFVVHFLLLTLASFCSLVHCSFPQPGGLNLRWEECQGKNLCILVRTMLVQAFFQFRFSCTQFILWLDRLSCKEWWTNCSIQIIVIIVKNIAEKIKLLMYIVKYYT